jgi:hypothetical protein
MQTIAKNMIFFIFLLNVFQTVLSGTVKNGYLIKRQHGPGPHPAPFKHPKGHEVYEFVPSGDMSTSGFFQSVSQGNPTSIIILVVSVCLVLFFGVMGYKYFKNKGKGKK